MNYYQARKRDDGNTGGAEIWHWTRMNDKRIWPELPCTEKCVHATAEAAEKHFYDYEAAHLKDMTHQNTQRKCEYPKCGDWTTAGLCSEQLGHADLCPKHYDEQSWRIVIPFRPVIQIISSY